MAGMFDDLIPQTEPTARITVNKEAPDYGGAIASIESGGKYDALGPVTRTGDRAYGKYQVMGNNIGPWSQEVFGQPIDPQTFLSNPQIQDAVFQHKFGGYVNKYGPEGAAKAWFAGEKGMNNPNARDQLGTSVASYGQRFTQALGPQAQAAPQQPAAQPVADLSFDDLIPAQEQSPVDARFGEFAPVPNAPQMERRLQATAPVYRGAMLPFTKNQRTGETFFDINSGLPGAIKRAVMLPGQVASGEIQLPSRDGGIPGSVDYDSPEGKEAFGRVLESASVMTPLSAASRVSPVVPAAKSAIPEISAVKEAATAAYKAADDAGVVISQQRYGDLAGNIAQSVRNAGFHPKIHPKVAGVLEEVANTVGTTPTLSELEIVRRIAQAAAKSIEKDERRVARIVVDKIDDFIKTLSESDIVSGDAAAASKAIVEARRLWGVSAKAETIEGLIQRAKDSTSQFSGSGYENALRTVFRNFAKNPKAMRGFSPEEQAAIRKVAQGGKIDNLFRYLGKLAPTGIVSGALSGGSGFAVGGPIGAVAAPAVGAVSRAVATRRTQNNANAARDTVLSRANPAVEPVQAPSVDRARKLFELMLKPSMIGGQNLATARAR